MDGRRLMEAISLITVANSTKRLLKTYTRSLVVPCVLMKLAVPASIIS